MYLCFCLFQKYVDREFNLFFSVMDESQSHYLVENILEYTYRPDLVNTSDPMFIESNQMHGKNHIFIFELFSFIMLPH